MRWLAYMTFSYWKVTVLSCILKLCMWKNVWCICVEFYNPVKNLIKISKAWLAAVFHRGLGGNVKMSINSKNAHIWVGYIFLSYNKNAQTRWKHIYWIHFSMRIDKVMWLCAMKQDNLTNQRTDLVRSIYMLLWSFWKARVKSRQSISV